MDKKHITIPISYDLNSVTSINPVISRYVVRVMYPGRNRNGSYFSKETIEKMVQTLGGIPVIGQYSEKDGDFMAHGDLVFRTNADGSSEIVTEGTEPYGFVNLKPNYWWSEHEDKDGVTREYLNVEVFLWTGRFKELEKLSEGKNNHSMEIEASGTFGEVDGTEYFICDENSYFTGLCILGEAVEPCFEGSAIVPYFTVKDERIKELNEALKVFNLNKEPTEPKEPEVSEEPKEPEVNDEYKEKYIKSLEEIQNLKNENNELQAQIKEYKKQEKTLKEKDGVIEQYKIELSNYNKKEIINEYKDKISNDNYNLLLNNLSEMSIEDTKVKTLEFSVEYLTQKTIFNNSTGDLTIDHNDSSNIESQYDDDSWQIKVLNKQEEK